MSKINTNKPIVENKPIVDVIIVKQFDDTTQTLKSRRIPITDVDGLNSILEGNYGQFTRLTAIDEKGARYFISAVKIHEIVTASQAKGKVTAKGGDR